MKAPNALWSALFVIVVFVAERLFGHEVVATVGASVVSVLAFVIKIWQENQAQPQVTTQAGTRSVGSQGPGFWRRVLTQ